MVRPNISRRSLIIALFEMTKCDRPFEELSTEVEGEIEEDPLDGLRFFAPPREELVEGVDGLGAEVIFKLRHDGLITEALAGQVMTHANGQVAESVLIWPTPPTLIPD